MVRMFVIIKTELAFGKCGIYLINGVFCNDIIIWVIAFVKAELAPGTRYGQGLSYELSLAAWRKFRDVKLSMKTQNSR